MRRAAFEAKTRVGARSSRSADDAFRQIEALTADEVVRIQRDRSIRQARFAYRSSPFYRDLYSSHGVTEQDLLDPDAFSALPVVTKADLRAGFGRVTSSEAGPRNSAVSVTGGSTGEPLRVLRDLRFPARALEWRLLRWWGVAPWADRGVVTRHILQGADAERHRRQWWPTRHLQLDAFSIDEPALRRFLDEWRSSRPRLLIGYVGGVLELARFVRASGAEFPSPDAIGLTASALTPGARADIESALGGVAYDHYRSAEVPWIAGESAARDGLLVFDDVRRVELLGDDGIEVPAGEEGEVVVSDLTNRVFPVIRYRLGDVTRRVPGLDSSGLPFTRIATIGGRRSDALRLASGTVIAGALGHLFDDAPSTVRQFDIQQAADYSVVLRCVPADDPGFPDALETAARRLRAATRGEVPVEVRVVEEIPHVGGKMRFIRSDAPG